MNGKVVWIALIASACLWGCGKNGDAPEKKASGTVKETPAPGGGKQAVAKIESKSGSTVTGTATFTEKDGKVTLVVEIEGAEPGTHGIHLHEKGDCSSADAKSAGAHWNPTSEDHGMMGSTEHAHSGDMGNLEVGPNGKGRLEFTSDRWTIGGDGKTNVIGKSVVIHAEADDLKTQPSGDAGDRVGCGVIG